MAAQLSTNHQQQMPWCLLLTMAAALVDAGSHKGKNDVLLDSGNLNKLRMKHSSITHCLAPCLPSSANCEIKSCMCLNMVVVICNGGEDDWGAKTQFFCNCIQFPLIKSAAKGKAAMVKDCMDARCMWTWKGVANGSGLAVLDDLSNPVHFSHACCSVFDGAVDPAQPLVGIVLEHKPMTVCESCVVVCLALWHDHTQKETF